MIEGFTADLHYGHGNIIKFCERPFKDVDHMTERLTFEINQRLQSPLDTLYHFGDFCCYGRARGVEGKREHASFYENQITAKVVHITGNHDKNNTVKGSVYGMFMCIGKFQVWGQHKPPWESVNGGINIPEQVTAYLCGHVHEKWKFETWNGKPVINVGCDVWKYRPILKHELIEIIQKQLNAIKKK